LTIKKKIKDDKVT